MSLKMKHRIILVFGVVIVCSCRYELSAQVAYLRAEGAITSIESSDGGAVPPGVGVGTRFLMQAQYDPSTPPSFISDTLAQYDIPGSSSTHITVLLPVGPYGFTAAQTYRITVLKTSDLDELAVTESLFMYVTPPSVRPPIAFTNAEIRLKGRSGLLSDLRLPTRLRCLSAFSTAEFTLTTMRDGGGRSIFHGRIDTLEPVTRQTVFLVHGIAQNGGETGDLSELARTLRSALDPGCFTVDAGYDFGNCAAHRDCPSDCTIGGTQYPPANNGAKRLAAYINQRSPVGDIIIIGYSMGGLIARDMILHDYEKVATNHHVAALVTLGSPHLGYPYEPIDDSLRCPNLAGQMFGDFRHAAIDAPDLPVIAQPARDFVDGRGHNVALSDFLYGLNNGWMSSTWDNRPDIWFAGAGTYCNNAVRRGTSRGCPDGTRNDGVVCFDSADIAINNGPDLRWYDDQYSHIGGFGTFFLFCDTQDSFPLFNPPSDGELMNEIKDLMDTLR